VLKFPGLTVKSHSPNSNAYAESTVPT